MDWIRKHSDSIGVVIAILSFMFYFNEKVNDRFAVIEKELAVIKTVLIMKNIMPNDFAHNECNNKE